VCALTALCVLRGKYVAVGEKEGGYFFLPPWSMWADWARGALDTQRTKGEPTVDVWINGSCYESTQSLPEPGKDDASIENSVTDSSALPGE
jgi:hypothetical protein